MSFEEEWAELKANATSTQSTAMQLNQYPADPGGGTPQGDLSVNAKDLAAIGDAAYGLYQRLEKDGDHAKAATNKAGSDLKGDFSLGGALTGLADTWKTQVDSVLQACAHISNHLDYTQKAHAGDEKYIATSMRLLTLDRGFDEGNRPQ